MSLPPRTAPMHVPVLTEVIEVPEATLAQPVAPVAAAPFAHTTVMAEPAAQHFEVPVLEDTPVTQSLSIIDEGQIAQKVLADVQRQIDGLLEYRLREALTPILARAAETLVRELRQELSKTMTDVVARSVAQEVARHRPRG